MKKKISIEGMSCGHCANHVKTALAELAGVNEVSVNLEGKHAIVDLAADVTDEVIKAAIDEVGYDVVAIDAL